MDVSAQNPWWNEGGLWQDPDLERVLRSPLRYRPQPISFADTKAPAILTLRGARRVGKTVTLKLFIAELIEQHGVAPKTIAWTALDTLRTLAQMEAHFLALIARHQPRIFVVDEVTSVGGWQQVVKKLRDDGTLAGRTVILTGSSAHDLRAGAERMAGRRGEVERPDRILWPMSFPDFLSQCAPYDLGDDMVLVREYLSVGGFPFRVERFINERREGRQAQPLDGFQVFDDVLFYEFTRRRLDRTIALEVLGRLSAVQCAATSYEGFAKPLSVAKDTARKYLESLGDAFLLATISSYDTARGRVAPKKDRKFVWVDPALGFAGPWLHQGEEASEAARAEWAVGVELLRRYETRAWEGLSAPRQVFTWKSRAGHEIDYLVVDRSRKLRLPVEVKYQHSISDWDFQVIERALGGGVLVTSTIDRQRPRSQAVRLSRFLTRTP